MRDLLFMPCNKPPFLFDTLKSFFANPPKSVFSYPLERGFKAFKHSAFVLIVLFILGILGAREVAYTLSSAFGIAAGLITILVFVFMIEIYRRSGFQCTLWAWMVLFMVVIQGTSLLGKTANTAAGKALGLDALPAASETVDPRKNCLRLATCQISPVFSHHEMAQEKISACETCLKQGKLFESTSKNENGVMVFDKYVCSDRPVPMRKCATSSSSACPKTHDALKIMGESTSTAYVDSVCEASGGKLCYVAQDGSGQYNGYAGRVPFESSSSGLGYPSTTLCTKYNPGKTCVELPNCTVSDSNTPVTNCYCDQYKFRRAANPCEFVETKCDMNSPLYSEAKLQLQQQKVDVSDIVNSDDLRNLVTGIDKALGFSN